MVKEYKAKKKRNPYLPILGFVILISLAVLSFFIAPLLIDFAKGAVGEAEFNSRLGSLTETQLQGAIAFVLWLILFASSMMIVSAALGDDPSAKDRLVRPRENASDREWDKYEKALKKQKAKEAQLIERMKNRDK